MKNANLIVRKIEEEKENRTKNIYLFTLSLSTEQEKDFNKKLKQIINEISVQDMEG